MLEKDDLISTAVHVQLRGGQVLYGYLDAAQYSTLDDLLSAFRRCFTKRIEHFEMIDNDKNTNRTKEQLGFPGSHLLSEFIQFVQDKITKLINIKLDITKIKGIAFSKRVGYMLGFDSQYYTVPSTEPISAKNKWYSVRSSYPPNLKVDGSILYIYCDLLLPQLVGNTSAPLLRIVHTSGEYGSSVEKTFHHKNYIPLIINNFSHIHIDIKTETGRYIEFNSGKTILTLHFRRRRTLLD